MSNHGEGCVCKVCLLDWGSGKNSKGKNFSSGNKR